jgi:hypothetical protein
MVAAEPKQEEDTVFVSCRKLYFCFIKSQPEYFLYRKQLTFYMNVIYWYQNKESGVAATRRARQGEQPEGRGPDPVQIPLTITVPKSLNLTLDIFIQGNPIKSNLRYNAGAASLENLFLVIRQSLL